MPCAYMYCSCLDLELVAGLCAMSLKDLPFPLHELSWEHYWVVQEELGLSEMEAERVLTQVLGPYPRDDVATWQPNIFCQCQLNLIVMS